MVRRVACSVLAIMFLISITMVSCINVYPVNATTYGPVSGGTSNLGGVANEEGYSLKLTRDTGLIFAGYTKSLGNGNADLWLIKTGLSLYTMQNGITGSFQREQWNVTYGGAKDDGALSVIQTFDNGYAAAGFTYSFGAGGCDAWLIKVAANGAIQWNKTFGGLNNDAANCLLQTSDGGYLVVGSKNIDLPSQSAWVIKTDFFGNLEWSKTLPGKAANSVVATSGEEYALAVEYPHSFGLIRIDTFGNELISKTYEPLGFDVASTQGVVVNSDGSYTLAGWVSSSPSSVHYSWLVKTDPSGQIVWSKMLSDLGAFDIINIANGGYALTGERAFLLLTDSDGNVEWNQINDGNPSNDTRYASLYPTNMQSIIEASPNHFVMIGTSNGGEYVNLQLTWIQMALKSGEQTNPAQVTILSPTNQSYTQRNIPLSFYVNEPTRYTIYNLNNLANSTINGNTTLINLPNGKYAITVYATDQDLNTGSSQTVAFNVNSVEPYLAPTVTIQSPSNQVYSTEQISLIFSVNQEVAWTAFSLDGGINRTAVADVTAVLFAKNGQHTLTVYAGQRPDVASSTTVSFTVDAPQPTSYGQPYPPVELHLPVQVSNFFQSSFDFFLSPVFLALAIVFLAASIIVVILVVLIARRSISKENNQVR